MPDSLLTILLLDQPASRLRELLAEAEAKITQGQEMVAEGGIEKRSILRALENKGQSTKGSATAGRSPAAGKPGSTREPIREIVATDPARVWMPSDVAAVLDEHFGIQISVNSVRAMMKRLLADGEFERPSPGANGFKLASTSGSAPVVEASENGAREPRSTAAQLQVGS